MHDRGLLATYANHAALAIERAQLRDQALRANLLQEVDEWRAALVSSVAHDLRTPLASIKVAVSDLREPAIVLPEAARSDLLETIEEQTDRLTRLVTTVLDLWRLEAGALEAEDASPSESTISSTRPPRSSSARLTPRDCAGSWQRTFPRSRLIRRSSPRHWRTCSRTPPGTARPMLRSSWRQSAGTRIGRRGRDRCLRFRPGSPPRAARSDLRAVPSRGRMAAGPASDWRLPRRSSRLMAAESASDRPGGGGARFVLTVPAASRFSTGLPPDDEVSS